MRRNAEQRFEFISLRINAATAGHNPLDTNSVQDARKHARLSSWTCQPLAKRLWTERSVALSALDHWAGRRMLSQAWCSATVLGRPYKESCVRRLRGGSSEFRTRFDKAICTSSNAPSRREPITRTVIRTEIRGNSQPCSRAYYELEGASDPAAEKIIALSASGQDMPISDVGAFIRAQRKHGISNVFSYLCAT